jgi:diguanylate cyclase (GGDEF)-like protein
MILGFLLYSISLLSQVSAAFYAITLFFRGSSYRLVCGFLAIGLTLMVGRRITPLVQALHDGRINVVDAALSVPISIFLMLGMIHFKKLLIDMEDKNFILEYASKKDSLTAAISRNETFARTELEIKKAFRSKKSISFLMVDIDHFKIVNDTYGHPIGDEVLISLANTCLEELREIDIFGRVGGEEFLIVLPETEKQEAMNVAERLRARIEKTACHTSTGKEIFITVSIGIAMFNSDADESVESGAIVKKYYVACDKAMYEAKQAGRNQVYCSDNLNLDS